MGSIRRLMTSLLLLLVAAGVLPFILPLKNGEPLLRWSDLRPPALPDVSVQPLLDKAAETLSDKNDSAGEKVEIYKWRDEKGEWHFSNHPPEAIPYERTVVNTAANVVRALTAPTSGQSNDEAAARKDPGTSEPPARASNPIQAAKGTQNVLDGRKARQDAAIEEATR